MNEYYAPPPGFEDLAPLPQPTSTAGPTYTLVLRAVPDPHKRPPLDRLKALLKRASRDYGLRCTGIRTN